MHKKIKMFDFKDGQILISTVLKFVFFVTPKKMNNRFYLLQKVYKVHVTANKQCTPISYYVQFKILMHYFFFKFILLIHVIQIYIN